jgi:hypothetical protein
MPMKSPPHPGDLIGTEVVEALGLNVSQAAQILNVRRATLSDLLLTWQGQAHAGNGPAHRKGIRPRHAPPPPCNSLLTWRKRASGPETSVWNGTSQLDVCLPVYTFYKTFTRPKPPSTPPVRSISIGRDA